MVLLSSRRCKGWAVARARKIASCAVWPRRRAPAPDTGPRRRARRRGTLAARRPRASRGRSGGRRAGWLHPHGTGMPRTALLDGRRLVAPFLAEADWAALAAALRAGGRLT